MTLQEWANKHNVYLPEIKGSDPVPIPDLGYVRGLWELHDYGVSSVSGGVIWLIKRV